MRRTKLCVTKLILLRTASHNTPKIDYDETYSPVIDVITFRYLISLVVSEKLSMQLMDIVTACIFMGILYHIPTRSPPHPGPAPPP